MKTFKIATRPGYGDNDGDTMEVDVIETFEMNGRLFIVHNTFIYYRVSDYLTGYYIGSSEARTKRAAISNAKKALKIHNDYDYSHLKVINP